MRPSQSVALKRLEDWIAKSDLREGSRLPPERSLCSQLGVSRTDLRQALAVLEFKGMIERHVGRGTFLAGEPDPLPVSRRELDRLAHQTSPHEAMVARLSLEPELASLAAIHATQRDLAEARSLCEAMRSASDWPTYERLDSEFHGLIALAAGNTLLSELHGIVNAVRVAVVWKRLDVPPDGPPLDYHSFREHEAIVSALDRRDRAGARAAMRSHIEAIMAAMIFKA